MAGAVAESKRQLDGGPERPALDTHALIYWVCMPDLLGLTARAVLERAEELLVPSICFWETALLVRKGRLALPGGLGAGEWTRRVLEMPRVSQIPLTAHIAVMADGLVMHPDPADRFIVATALTTGSPLITKDRLLIDVPDLETIW